jgi:AraC-like DNA-binding protein
MIRTDLARSVFGLRYAAPAADLRRFVSSYHLFHADLHHLSDVLRADLAQLRFMVSGRGAYMFADGSAQVAPEVSLIGPTLSATRFDAVGPMLVFGVSLLPAGWSALVRSDASRHTGRIEDGTAVLGPLLGDMMDALRNAGSIAEMISIADAVMRALAARAGEPPLWFTKLADRWLMGAASPRVDDFVAELGLSARQVERLTKRSYGGPPKLIARKYRALRAASLLGSERLAWQDAASDGYYDHSHFIRDFKQFTGVTPRQLQAAPTPLTRLTLERRKLTGLLPKLQLFS